MLRKINKLRNEKGSMMIEALAMLGLISMVTPVIYKKAAERTTELQDINAASQVRTVVKAIDDYLRDNYGTITGGGEVTSSTSTIDFSDFASGTDTKSKVVPIDHFKDYLPIGFQPDGKIFKGFDVAIKQVTDASGARKALTTVLLAKTSSDGTVDPTFTKLRSSRIASMIGTNGGYIDGDKATGVQGVWEIPKGELPSNAGDGTIVATSIEAVADGTAGGSDVLHRVHVDGHPEYNVMETTLSMNNNTIDGLHELISHGNTIKMRQQNETNALTLDVSGSGLFEDSLQIGDALTPSNRFYADRNILSHTQGIRTGSGPATGITSTNNNSTFYVNGTDGSFFAAKSATSTSPSDAKFEVSSAGNTRADGTLKAIKLTDRKNFLNTVDYGLYATEREIYLNPKSWFRAGIGANTTADRNNALNGTGTVTGAGLMAGNTSATSSVSTIYGQTINNYTPSFNVQYNHAAGTADFYNGLMTLTGLGGQAYNSITNSAKINANTKIDGSLEAGLRNDGNYNLMIEDDNAYVRSIFGASERENGIYGANMAVASDFFGVASNASFDLNDDGTNFYTKIGEINSAYGRGIQTGYNDGTYLVQLGNKASRIGGDLGYIQVNHPDNTTAGNIKMLTGNSDINHYLNIMPLWTQIGSKYSDKSNEFGLGSVFYGTYFKENDDYILKVGENGAIPTSSASAVHIRKGAIDIARQSDATKFDDELENKSTSHIKVDRLISNEGSLAGADGGLVDYTGSGDYDHFQVNPAYTSMMNDIKLATRGGARLSDILPDFINKGIYVLDNTFKSGYDWTKDSIILDNSKNLILSTMGSANSATCSGTKCDTSPWLGFVPTPNCPPGYMKVATITPIRFNMAQAGIMGPLEGSHGIDGLGTTNEHYRFLYTHLEPRGDDKLTLIDADGTGGQRTSQTFVALPSETNPTIADTITKITYDNKTYNVKQATIFNQPYNYQINTWLNTTMKAYYSKSGDSSSFKGWHGLMGFIYPADDYRLYYNEAILKKTNCEGKINQTCSQAEIDAGTCDSCKKNPSEILWNLFPVYKQELSAITTVYCYFDRTNTSNFNENYVDNYLPHAIDKIGDIRNQDKTNASNRGKLNDPALQYNTLW